MIVKGYCKCSRLYCLRFLASILLISIIYKLLRGECVYIIAMITSSNATTIIPITTNSSTTVVKTSSKGSCLLYTVPDTRPFFEREPPQLDLPRPILNVSDHDLFRHLRSLRLLVLTTARNMEANIDHFRKHIEPIVDLFHPSSRILICESDSTDKTVDKLYQWHRAQVYSFGNLSKVYPERTERLAFCRNKLLNISHEITADYLLVADLDIFAINVSAFLSNFRYNTDDWSVMTASSPGGYYDIWALRTLSDSNLNYDVWHRIWDIERSRKGYCSSSIFDQIIDNHRKIIPVEHGLIEVRSAFGGAGLYKANITYGCQYSGANITCEHVPFHLCILEKHQARIFINPKLLINDVNKSSVSF